MLQTTIKNDMVAAWKLGNTVEKDILSLLLSKIKNKAIDSKVTELSDSEIYNIIQKFIKELEDEKAMYASANRTDNVNTLKIQIDILGRYLPKMLSEDEIKAEIAKLEDKSMKSVMSYFKTNYAGKVDMSLVSKIARGA